MGTRSRIGVMHGDNCKSIYVHWDGYPTGVGRTLLDHYDSAKANHLVALGDVSSLGALVEIPEGVEHSFNMPNKEHDITVFYGRDRGEDGIEFKTDDTFAKFFERADSCGAEYYYVMKDGVWYMGNTYTSSPLCGKLEPLAEVLSIEEAE